jgi:hypothetical protein
MGHHQTSQRKSADAHEGKRECRHQCSTAHFGYLVRQQRLQYVVAVAEPPGSVAILAASGAGWKPALPGTGYARGCEEVHYGIPLMAA